jgi:cytidyltransferase-like protein
VDGEYVAFDQEYVIEDYPVNVVLVRCLNMIYMDDRHMEETVPLSYFIKRYALEEKWNLYGTMSNTYLAKLRSKTSLGDFNRAHQANTEVINSNRQKINYPLQKYMDIFVHYLDGTKGREVYIFGSGRWARRFVAQYGDQVKLAGMIDNDRSKWGTTVDGIPVCALQSVSGDCKVIICVKQYAGIVRQLKAAGITDYSIYDPYLDVERLLGTSVTCAPRQRKAKTEEGASQKPYRMGYVAGVFDLFHVGHLNLLRRAKSQCEYLLVGVVSDEQAGHGKTHGPYVGEQERLQIVQACRYVDEAFVLPVIASGTRDVYRKYHFDAQFSGSDYEHEPYWLETKAWLQERGSDLIFFPYTETTSSTKLKAAIEKND